MQAGIFSRAFWNIQLNPIISQIEIFMTSHFRTLLNYLVMTQGKVKLIFT